MTPEELEAGHQLSNSPTGVQPRPTKANTFDGSFDDNYTAVTKLHTLFQSLTDQFDPTHIPVCAFHPEQLPSIYRR